MRFRALLLLAIAAGVHAGPLSFEETQCATTCVPSTKFGYETGNTYRFEYDAETVTSLAGAADEHSALFVRATADIHVLSPCELVLTLRDTRLEEADPSDLSRREPSRNNAGFTRALEENALRFSFQDGAIPEVCASVGDDTWVVNVKRGVLSAFQNSMPNIDDDHTVPESDVSGNCEAEYRVDTLGFNTVTLQKSKNLLSCTDRTGHFTSLQANSYNVPSEIQSLPLLRSTHDCEQTITSGILVRSECRESHVFRPFSKQSSGAQTSITQSLVYQGIVRASPGSTGSSRRTTMLFEHEARSVANSNDITMVTDVLQDICAADDIRPETPQLFARLTYAMRQMDVASLTKLHRMVERGRVCSSGNTAIAEKFFHDAIPATNTEASVALIRDLIQSGEISGDEVDMWVSSLAFIPEPTLAMVDHAKALLENGGRQAYLSVSSLVHAYCKSDVTCMDKAPVNDVINVIVDKLGYNCRASSDEEMQQMMVALKALGNSGASERVTSTLTRCVAQTDNRIEVRLAAIEAYRRLPCDQSRAELLGLVSSASEDVEVRIAAYLAVMQCPTSHVILAVKRVLETETINQVGSFIWTHLTNLQETADPFKQDIRAILEDDILAKEFNMDARKFSRNYEGSLFFDSINAGARYESNLVWSPSSFLPRSAMLNLTVDMFGKSVNLFEIGGRAEGLEQYLEMMFGPNGYFPNSRVNDAINARLASIDEGLKNRIQRDPKASGYMKIFGNELKYWDTDFVQRGEPFNILNFLIMLAQDHQAEVTRSMLFLDSEMTTPTAAGFPLKLAVNGTAAINVKVGGKMDLRRAATLPSTLLIDGYLKPSAAVTVTSTMGVDMHAARTGLRMVSSMHTSTQVTGTIDLQETTILNAHFDMPDDTQEILNVESKFFMLHGDEEREQSPLATSDLIEETKCSSDRFVTITGVRICKAHSYAAHDDETAPDFPFNGPMRSSVTLEKADTHTGYDIEARFETRKERKNNAWAYTNVARVAFNTPGSRVDREFAADVTLDQSDMKLNANLLSPWKCATLDASVATDPSLLGANLEITVDQSPAMVFTAQVATETLGEGFRFTPLVQLRTPWLRPVTLRGQTRVLPGPSVDMELTLEAFSSPVTLTGGIELSGQRYQTDIALTSPIFNSHVTGFTAVKDSMLSTRMEVEYDYNNAQTHSLVLNSKLKDTSTNRAMKYSVNTAIASSEYPEFNFELDTDFLFNAKHMENNFALTYGPNTDKRISFTHSANFKGDYANYEFDQTWGLKWNDMGVNMNGRLTHSHVMHSELDTAAMVTYAPGKEVNLGMSIKKLSIEPLQVSGDLTLTYPGRHMRLYKVITEDEPGVYDTHTILQWQTDRQISVDSVYRNEHPRHSLTSQLTLPSGSTSSVDSSIVLSLYNFALSTAVNHNNRAYSSALSYNLDVDRLQMDSNLDLVLPRRHVTVETAGALRPGDYSATVAAFWDADNDRSQKVVLNTRLALAGGRHEGQVKVVYPGRKVTLVFKQELMESQLSHHSELAWNTKKSIELYVKSRFLGSTLENAIELKTPFFNDVKLDTNFEKSASALQGNVNLDYGSVISAEVTMNTENDVTESSLLVHTPFRGWERVAMTTSHTCQESVKDLQVELAKNEEKIEMHLMGSKEVTGSNTAVRGNVMIKTPFTEDIEIQADHSCDGTTMQTNVNAVFGSQEMTSSLGMTIEGMLTHSGEFHLSTPYVMFADVESNWASAINGLTDFSFSHDMRVNRDKVAYAIANQYSHGNVETSLNVQTTFRAMRNLAIVTTSTTPAEGSLRMLSTVTLNDVQHARLQTDLTDSGLDCEARISLQTSMRMAQDVTLVASRTQSVTPHLDHVEFNWAPNKMVALDFERTQNYGDFSGEWRLTTPFRNFERMVLNLDHRRQNYGWNTAAFFEYAPNKRVSVATSFESSRTLATTLEFDAPCPYLRSLRAAISHTGSGTDFEHTSSVTFNMDAYPEMKYESALTMRGTDYLVGSAEIVTPCPYLRNHRISVDHQLQGDQYITSAAATAHPRHEVTVQALFKNIDGQFKLNGELQTTCDFMQSLSFGAEHTGSGLMFTGSGHVESRVADFPITYTHTYNVRGFRLVTVDAELQTPVTEKLAYSLSHSMNGVNINTNSELQWSSQNRITLENTLRLDNGVAMETRLVTPCPMLRTVNIAINHEGTTAERFTCRSEASVDTQYGEYKISSDVSVDGFEAIQGVLNVNDMYRLNLEHNIRQERDDFDIDSALTFTWESKTMRLSYIASSIRTEPRVSSVETWTFTSPFRGFEEIQYISNVTTKTDAPVKIDTSLTLKYAPRKQINVNYRVDLGDQSGYLNLQTPFAVLSQAELEIAHVGELTDFSNHASLSFTSNRRSTSVHGHSTFQLGQHSLANAEVTTNINGFERFSVESDLHLIGARSFDGRLDLSSPALTVQATGQLRTEALSDLSASFSIGGPVEASLTMAHAGGLQRFENSLEVTLNGDTARYEGAFESSPISGRFVLTTPCSIGNQQVEFSADGDLYEFTANAEVTYGPRNQKITTSGSLNVNRGFESTFTLATPYTQNIDVSISHVGDHVFQHNSHVTYGRRQLVSLQGNFDVRPCHGALTLISPLGEIGVTIATQGDIRAFDSNTTFRFNRHQASIRADFSSVDGFALKTSLASTFRPIDGLSAEASLEYTLPEFNAKLQMEGFNQVIAFESGLSLNPGLAYVKLQSPCAHLSNIDITTRYTGDLEQFEATFQALVNGERVTASANFDSTRNFEASFNLNVPNMPEIRGTLSHTLRRVLDSEMTVVYGDKQIRAAANFNLDPIDGSVTLTSPCPYLKDVSLALRHDEKNGRYETVVTFEHDLVGKTEIEHTLMLSPDIEATLSVTSPCPYFRNAQLALSHSGDLSNFQNSLRYGNDGERWSYEGSFRPWHGEVAIRTPRDVFGNMELEFDHSVQGSDPLQFSNYLSMRIADEESILRSSLTQNPLNFELTATHQGESVALLRVQDQGPGQWNNFDATVVASLESENILSGSVQFDATSDVSGRLDLDTYWTDAAELSFTHTGSYDDFQCHGTFSYAGSQWFDGDLRFALNPLNLQTTINTAIPQLRNLGLGLMINGELSSFDAESSLTHNSANLFQSSFSAGVSVNSAVLRISRVKAGRFVLENMSFSANFEGDETAFRTNIEGTMFGKTVSAEVEFDGRPLAMSVQVNTPFRGYETVAASYNHRGSFSSAFTANAELTYKRGKTISVTFGTKNYKKMTINFEVKSPFGEGEFTGKYMNADSSITSKVEVKVGSINIDGSVDLQMTSTPSATVQLNTPFRGWEEIQFTMEHSMENNGAIASQARFVRNGQAFGVMFAGNFVDLTDMGGELTVTTPLRGFERYQLSAQHSGDLRRMQTDVSVMFPPENVISGSFLLSTMQGISTELKTNIRGFEDLAAEVTFNGDLSAWSSSAMVRLAPRQIYNAAVEFSMNARDITTSASFNSPLRGFESLAASLRLEGQLDRFSGNGEFSWGERTVVSATVEGALPYSATFNVNGKSMGWQLTPRNDGRVTGNAFLNWSRQTTIQVDLQGNFRGDITAMQMDGTVEITSPFAMARNVRLTAEHGHDSSRLDNSMTVMYNGAKLLEHTINMNTQNGRIVVSEPMRVEAGYTVRGDSIEIAMETPFTVQATARVNANEITVAMTEPYTINFSVTMEGNAAGFQMSQPYPVDVMVSLSGRTGALRIEQPFEFNAEFDFDNVNGQVDMKYPYDFNANYQLGYNGGQLRTRGVYDFDAAYSIDNNGGSINVQGPYQVDARYSMDSTHGSIDIARPIAIKAEYSFGMNGGYFTMQQPMEIDVRATLTDEIASVIMQKPMPFDATVQYSWSAISVEMNNPLQINARASLTDSQAALIISQPYQFDAVATYSWTNASFVMSSPLPINMQASMTDEKVSFVSQGLWNADAYASWNSFSIAIQNPIRVNMRGSVTSNSAQLEMTSPYQYRAEAALVDNGASLTVSGPYPIDAALKYDDHSASFTMSRPVPVDIAGVYEGLSGRLQMTAPYSFETSYNFNSAEGVLSLEGPYRVDARYTLSDNGGSFIMTTPFRIDARFTLDSASGEIDIEQPILVRARYSFDRTGGVFNMEQPIPIDARLSISESEGELKGTGPVPVDASYTWTGESGTFQVSKPVLVSAAFTLTPSEGSFRMQQPYSVDARYTLAQNGGSFIMDTPVRVNARYTLDRNGGSIVMTTPIEVQATFTLSQNGGSFEMQKPIEVDAAYTFDGQRGTFNMEKPFAVSGEGSFDGHTATLHVQRPFPISAEGSFDGTRASFTMTEPYSITMVGQYEGNSASFAMSQPYQISLEGTLEGNSATVSMYEPYRMSAEVYFDGERASFSLDRPYPISMEGSFDGQTVTFNMRQPCQVSATGSFDGRRVTFSLDKPYPIEFDGSFDGETATFNMRQPYPMSATGSFDGRSVAFSLNKPYPVEFEGSFDGETAAFNMRQPYPMSASGSFDGRSVAFSLDRPYPVAFEGSFDGTTASFTMRQPIAASAEASYTGSSASFRMDGPYPVAMEGSFDGSSSASFTMRQPYPMTAAGSFDGTTVSFGIDRPYPVAFEGSFDGVHASFDMAQPYPMSVSGHFDGRTGSFNMDRPYAVSFEGGLVDSTISFTMRQPYTMSMSVGFDGQRGSFNIDRPYPISLEGGITGSRANFEMRQPYPLSMDGHLDRSSASIAISGMARLDADASFDGSRGRFAMREPYRMNADGQFDGRSAAFNLESYRVAVDGSFDGSRANLNMRKPFPVNVDGHFDGQSASFNLDNPYQVSMDGSFDGSRASFNMRQPVPVSAEGSFDGRQAAVRLDGPYRVDLQGAFDGTRGSLNMQQPYLMSLEGHFDGLSASFSLDRPYPISVTAGLGLNDAMFVMETPMEIDVQASYSLTEGSLVMTKPYPVDARYTLNQNEASFTMRQPYPVQVSASYSASGASLNMAQPMVIDANVELSANEYAFIMRRPTPVEVRYTTSSQAGTVTMVRPMPMQLTYDYMGSSLNDFTGHLGVNWNTQRSGSAMDLSVTYKDESSATAFDMGGVIQLDIPTRSVSVGGAIRHSPTEIRQQVELSWDKSRDRTISYLVDFKDNSRYSSKMYELTAGLTTPLRSVEANMQHSDNGQTINTDAGLKWDASRDESKHVSFTNTYTCTATRMTHALLVNSPLLNKEIALTNEITMQEGHVFFASNHKLAYHVDTRHDLVMSTRVSDEGNTRYGNHNYTATMTVRHQMSTIDLTLGGHAARSDRALSVGSYVNYMMTHGDMAHLQLWAEVHRIANTLNVQLTTPFYSASVSGLVSSGEASLVAQDGVREIRATGEITDDGFELRAYPFPQEQTMVSLRGTYRASNEIELTISHGSESAMVTDSEISLDLQDDHLVHSRFYVRPALLRDVKTTLRNIDLDSTPAMQTLATVRKQISRELSNKVSYMAENALDLSSALRNVSGEAESWMQDVKATRKAFNKMYWADEFYLKSMGRAATQAYDLSVRAIEKMADALEPAMYYVALVGDGILFCMDACVEELRDFWAAYGPAITEFCQETASAIFDTLRQAGDVAATNLALAARQAGQVTMAAVERVAVVMEPYVRTYVAFYNRFYAWVERKQAEVYLQLQEITGDMDFEMLNSVVETAQGMMLRYMRFSRFLANQIAQIDFLRPVYDARISLADNIADAISLVTSWSYDVTRVYVMVLENVHDVIADVYARVMTNQQSVYVREAVRELAEQLHWSYRYLDIEGKLATVLDTTLTLAIDLLRANLDYLTSDWLRLDLDRVMVFAPRDGLFEFQIWIPQEWPSFQTVPFTAIDWSDVYNRAMIILDNLLPDDLNPWDVYYQYKPSTNMGDWIPPFEAIATISGQYITTFDGRAFEFLGSCSYVLARDVIDSTFTLFQNYDKQHVTLVSDNKQVEVSMDGSVRVDMQPIEAPYEYENTQITRMGDMLKVAHARGFSLECDLLNQMCIFRMSGWYHGKVAGLMGTYTNEPTDDWMMANGELAGDVQQLARSWEATGSCTAHDNLAAEHAMVETRASGRVCGALFMSRLSPMRNCFKVVDARPYLAACINDVEESGDDRRGVCKVAAAYAARCHAKHVDVRPPRVCMRSEEYTSTPSADVVFVVEQKPCNDEIVAKLDNVAKMIDRALIDRGMTDNRFGVVGFGGIGVHDPEHIQTVSGSVFGTSRDIATIENSMLFTEGGENTDSLRAMNMAIDYPFRVGAAKSIVMITCSACEEQSTGSDDVSARLADAGIQLHVVVEHEFNMGNSAGQPKTTFLFGIDSSAAFTKSDVTDPELSGDLDLYRQVIPPSDACAQMALQTRGSFFNLEKLTGGRVRTQKSFMDVFARRVAKTAESTPLMGRPDEEPEIYYDDKTFTLNFDDYMRS